MAVTYGFYDSVGSDRRYNAIQFSSLIDSLIIDGVFANILDALFVEDGTGLHIMVNAGRAWFEHTWTYNDGQLTLDISTPHAVLPRIDTVVLETNSDQAVRANSIKVITGTPASSPVPPTLTHTATIHQHPLADVYVGPNVTEINQADITNRIGTSDCPFVVGILETINIDTLFAQWQDDFETWFLYLQNELDENQAANLLAQIMEHDHSNPLHTQVVSGGIADGAVTLLKLAAALRFEKLFEFVGDGVNLPDWSSIPQTFTHLLLIYNGASTYSGDGLHPLYMQVNGDAAAHYYFSDWWRSGATEQFEHASVAQAYGLNCGWLPANTSYLYTGSGFVFFPNYKGTTFYKTAIQFSYWHGHGTGGSGALLGYSYWNQVTAINRLTGTMSNFKPRTGSIFSLYGFN